jgi:hypothetical protein
VGKEGRKEEKGKEGGKAIMRRKRNHEKGRKP